MKDLLSVRQASEMAGLKNGNTVNTAINEGKLPAIEFWNGSRKEWRILHSDVEAWITEREERKARRFALSVKDFADKANMSPKTVRVYISKGRLEGFKHNGQWYIPPHELRRHRESTKKKTHLDDQPGFSVICPQDGQVKFTGTMGACIAWRGERFHMAIEKVDGATTAAYRAQVGFPRIDRYEVHR